MGEIISPAETTSTMETQGEASQNGRPRWSYLVLLFLLIGLLGAGYWWFFMRGREFTDNAYVMADSATIAARVPGTITRVRVENDDRVRVGQVLVELDPRDFQARVDEARAALKRVAAEIEVARLSLQLIDTQTASKVRAAAAVFQGAKEKEQQVRHQLEELRQKKAAATADFNHARRELERYSHLYKQGAGTEQQRDRARTLFKKAKARLEAVTAEISAARSGLQAVKENVKRARAQLDGARADRARVAIQRHKLAALRARKAQIEAQLTTARLNLSYCTIRAPLSGYVAQKRAQVGDRLAPGQPILAIVPLQDVYAEANFKETQLEGVRVGQPVDIRADIYPGHLYHGTVAGIRAGTGAAFSLLPPENATGNWIKVVQRVPVRIRFEEPPPADFPLRVGLSLEVTVHTGDQSGPRLLAGLAAEAAASPTNPRRR